MRRPWSKTRTGMIVIAVVAACIALASIAIAQSQSAFSLNSPASFPVDI